MKRFLILFASFSWFSLHALPIGNPSEPCMLESVFCGDPCCEEDAPLCCWCDMLSARVGISADYVFNCHLQVDSEGMHHHIEHTSIHTNAGYLALNICDRFDIFTNLGASRFFIKSNVNAFDPNAANGTFIGQRLYIESSTAFAWSVGVRGILWNWGCTTLGAEAEYFSSQPEVFSIGYQANKSAYPSGVRLKYREAQVGAALSYNIANVAFPYMGVKWSVAHMDFDNAPINISGLTNPAIILVDLENSRDWGYAVGMTFDICSSFGLTFEWRMQNEEAFYINGQLRF